MKYAYLKHDDAEGFVICKLGTSEVIAKADVGLGASNDDWDELDWDWLDEQALKLGYTMVWDNLATNYRSKIEEIIARYEKAGDCLVESILEGSPEVIDSKEAINLAHWLRDEADGEWGEDARHQAIASEILRIVGGD